VYNYDSLASDLATVGNNRVWQAEQEPSADGRIQTSRIQVVRDSPGRPAEPKPEGNVLRVELRPFELGRGDVTTTATMSASRAEVYDRQPTEADTPANLWADPEGSVRWFGFQVYLPPEWAFADRTEDWLLLTQWKGRSPGSPPVSLQIAGTRWAIAGAAGRTDLVPVRLDHWTTFEIGVHFSSVPSAGWVEVWIDGALALPRTAHATMGTVEGRIDPNYLKQGIYRSSAWQTTHVAYFSDAVLAMTHRALDRTSCR
jgi:hypothetical protein